MKLAGPLPPEVGEVGYILMKLFVTPSHRGIQPTSRLSPWHQSLARAPWTVNNNRHPFRYCKQLKGFTPPSA